MLSILLKLVLLYFIFKLLVDRFVPVFKGIFKNGQRDRVKSKDSVKRYESIDEQVKEADFDEL